MNIDYSTNRTAKGFTLLEVLIVLGIVAILSGAVITVINPLELMKISRDAKRLSDLSGIDNAVTLYRNMFSSESLTASTTTVFLSLPDTDNTLPNDCDEYSLPALPGGWNYSCVIKDDYQKINGTGWLPIDFSRLQDAIGTVPLNTLAVDPSNTGSRYYSFTSNGTDWELTLSLEAQKNEETQINDGGNDDTLFEKGTNLAVYPVIGYKLAQTYPDLLTVLTNSQTVYAAGSAGQVPYFTGANTIAGEDNLFWDSNNNRLGIGTNTPSYPLDVLGNINFTGALSGGTVPWSLLASFPSACPGGQYVSQVDTSLTCSAPPSLPSGTSGQTLRHDGTNWTATSTLFIAANGNVGIGTTNPAATFNLIAPGVAGGSFFYDVYSDTQGPIFTGRRARGTSGSPAAVQTNDLIVGYGGRGYGATGFPTGTGNRGAFTVNAAENWTDTAQGAYLRFLTTQIGTTTFSEKMRISDAGNVGIGTVDPGTYKLSVNGNVNVTGALYVANATVIPLVNYIAGAVPKYKTASDIYITAGEVYINGYIGKLTSDLTVNWSDIEAGQSEAASTWYYLYLVKPATDGGAPTAKISSTAPSVSTTGGARYHPTQPTWRFVGRFRNDGGSDIFAFYSRGIGNDVKYLLKYAVNVLYLGTATTWTPIDCSGYLSPIDDVADVEMGGIGTGNAGYAELDVWFGGESGLGQALLWVAPYSGIRISDTNIAEIPIVGQNIYYYCSVTNMAGYGANLYIRGSSYRR